jgi:predicted nucleic acid-binding protein
MQPHLIVIDTQCLFDWMLFRNALCEPWPSHLDSIRWKWVFTNQMQAEFDFVLAKGLGGERWPARPEAIAQAWAAHGHELPQPEPLGATARLHCSDPDDQKFIDLAIATRAHTLLTRDKALLKLARRAAERHGVRVCKPEVWTAELVAQ